VFRALLPSTDYTHHFVPYYPAELVMRIEGQEADANYVPVYADMLGDAVSAGVRGVVEWQETDDTEQFTFGHTTMLDGSATSGAGAIDVYSTALGPATGFVRLSSGTPDQDSHQPRRLGRRVWPCEQPRQQRVR
jgi:hypothetical protein